jgi:hypothetical protein
MNLGAMGDCRATTARRCASPSASIVVATACISVECMRDVLVHTVLEAWAGCRGCRTQPHGSATLAQVPSHARYASLRVPSV